MVLTFEQTFYAFALALLGTGAGFGLGFALFQGSWKPRDFSGQYFGGLPILGMIGALLLMPSLPLNQEILALVGVVAGFALLGMVRDYKKVPLNVVLPYQILLVIIGAFFRIDVPHEIRIVWITLTVVWPMLILYCLKLASLVFEMPFLLCLGSSITFILFFPYQQSTPPWVAVSTIGLIVVSTLCLFFLWRGRKGYLGDSGLFALGYLLSGISMLGRSKRLLMFGLAVPSMVIFYPFVLICLLIMASYLGNELYQTDPKERRSHYKWTLSRERLVVFSALVFLCLNFLELFITVKVSFYGYAALLVFFGVAVFSFIRTFARRSPVQAPEPGSRIQILGIPLDVLAPDTVLRKMSEFMESPDAFHHVVTADSLAVLRALKDKSFGRIINRASLVLPDGAGLVWAADFLGTPLPTRIPGVSLVSNLCQLSASKGWTMYFVGSRPGIAQDAAKILMEKHAGLKVVGAHHGFFHEGSEAEDALVEDIIQKKPNILLAALGVPKQELFIQRLRPLASKMVAIGVGGSFDVISGNLPRAPEFMQRFALEWLFRLWKEPRRLTRIMRIPWFVLAVIRAKWQSEEFVV